MRHWGQIILRSTRYCIFCNLKGGVTTRRKKYGSIRLQKAFRISRVDWVNCFKCIIQPKRMQSNWPKAVIYCIKLIINISKLYLNNEQINGADVLNVSILEELLPQLYSALLYRYRNIIYVNCNRDIKSIRLGQILDSDTGFKTFYR